MRQLIDAQQEANRLHELARQEDRRSRIENTTTKFPQLKLLERNTIDEWYKQVLPMINGPKYRDFYDNRASDIIADGSHLPLLNEILYNELYRSCSDTVREYILAQDLNNDGISLLHNITTTFATPWTTMQKENNLQKWLRVHQEKNESIRDFFYRCLKERQKPINHGVPCDEDSLIHLFIMGLPAQFTSIQERVDDLPSNWKVNNIHLLPGIAEAFLENKNNIRDMHRAHKDANTQQPRPQSNNTQHSQQQQQQQDTPRPLDAVTQQRQDDIYAAIMSGTFDYHSFTSRVPQDSCIYHGDSHPGGSLACSALRRIYNKAASRGTCNTPLDTLIRRTPPTTTQTQQQYQPQRQTRPQTNSTAPHHANLQPRPIMPQQQLPTQLAPPTQTTAHVQPRVTFQQPTASNVIVDSHDPADSQEEISPDELHDTIINMIQEDPNNAQLNNHSNDTSRGYPFCANTFVTLTNSTPSNLKSYTKLLIDSGASHTMINDKRLFKTLHNLESESKFAILADGITKTKIMGYGDISGYTRDGHEINIKNCLFIPTLSISLLSTKSFSRTKGQSVHTTNGITHISFPTFTTTTDDNINSNLIFLHIHHTQPVQSHHMHLKAIQEPLPESKPSASHPDEMPEPTTLDKLIHQILSTSLPSPYWMRYKISVTYRDNYNIVHRGVLTQKNPHSWQLTIRTSKRMTKTFLFSTEDIINLHKSDRLIHGHKHLLQSPIASKETDTAANDLPTPSLPTHDLPISSVAKDTSFTIDQLQRSFGFRNIHTMLKK